MAAGYSWSPLTPPHTLCLVLQQCSETELVSVYDMLIPYLTRDFVGLLPQELSLHLLSFVDTRTLVAASMVSSPSCAPPLAEHQSTHATTCLYGLPISVYFNRETPLSCSYISN